MKEYHSQQDEITRLTEELAQVKKTLRREIILKESALKAVKIPDNTTTAKYRVATSTIVNLRSELKEVKAKGVIDRRNAIDDVVKYKDMINGIKELMLATTNKGD